MGTGVKDAGSVAVIREIGVDVNDATMVAVGDGVSIVGTVVTVDVRVGDSPTVAVGTGLEVGEYAAIVCAIAVPIAFGSTVGAAN